MIIARFNCPACETPIEAPANSVAAGVRCPQCDTGFVPGTVQTSDEAVEGITGRDMPIGQIKSKPRDEIRKDAEREREQIKLQKEREAHNEKWKEYNGLKESAGTLSLLAVICVVIGALATFVGFTGETNGIAFIVGGGSFSTAFTLFIVAQIIHIRAALEKLHLKD